MDFLTCKNCGCESVTPLEVELADVEADLLPDDEVDSSKGDMGKANKAPSEDPSIGSDEKENPDPWDAEANEFLDRLRDGESLDKETHFYTCQVCGDNWLSIKETNGTECEITFIHQMGIKPSLRRVALMSTSIVLNEKTVESWEYYFGEDKIDADDWHKRLKGRRQVLKSICSN